MSEEKLNSVFAVWHRHEVGTASDEKLIGVYASVPEAEAAIARVANKPGFRDTMSGFEIQEYVIGRDGWTEGFISEDEALE
ncbi:hypothetical protein Terro_0804 [Terriglobus roseus DSM 18391]|uniref:DUF7336 domain-containing protein n=1 Tax=Terriglobus roseus (strain DSM 18391 / NRRL B-41598 / KBS 63) TaxID=926566 RepID=I3ZD18_TERRK|nr:hypothetical protein Terro_0804 [Terriglobus roseus DSM 18391]